MVGNNRVGRHARTWDPAHGRRDPDLVLTRDRNACFGHSKARLELEGDPAFRLPIPADAF